MQTALTKEQIINLLYRFIAQRSGIDYQCYGERSSFMSDYRRIVKHGADARELLRIVAASGVDAQTMAAALPAGKRLSLIGDKLEYCTGQYFPTEYRAAVCRALVDMLCAHYGGAKNARTMVSRAIARRWMF